MAAAASPLVEALRRSTKYYISRQTRDDIRAALEACEKREQELSTLATQVRQHADGILVDAYAPKLSTPPTTEEIAALVKFYREKVGAAVDLHLPRDVLHPSASLHVLRYTRSFGHGAGKRVCPEHHGHGQLNKRVPTGGCPTGAGSTG